MGITLLKMKNGKLRPKWYGRYTVEGKSRTIPLCRWKGIPPTNGSIRSQGDEAFERSREEAKALFRTMLLDVNGGNQSQEDLKHTIQIVAQHKFRNKYKQVTNEEVFISLPSENETEYPLWEKFMQISGGCQCSPNQLRHIKSMVKNFIHFILERQQVEKFPLNNVSGRDILAFLQSENITNLAPRSWNEYLIIRCMSEYHTALQHSPRSFPYSVGKLYNTPNMSHLPSHQPKALYSPFLFPLLFPYSWMY